MKVLNFRQQGGAFYCKKIEYLGHVHCLPYFNANFRTRVSVDASPVDSRFCVVTDK